MKDKFRQRICLVIGATVLLGAAVLLAGVLKNYGHSTSIVIGPYKKAVLALLGLIFAAAAGFYLKPFNSRTVSGSLLIAASVLWFTGRMLLTWRSPETSLISLMDQLMPIPLICFGAGAALWVGEFLPKERQTLPLSEKWRLILVFLLMFICLEPVLGGGFAWDDAFFSVEAQAMRVTGESIFQRVWKEIMEYVQIGRINPFATFHFLVFYFIPDVRIYKLLLVLLTLLDGCLFYRFLKLWDEGYSLALAVLLIVPLSFQLRLYHDPLNSYYGLMQVMFCELMLSLICFVCWLREGKTKYLILSLLFFMMGLMSYEMFFPLTALFLIPAMTYEKNFGKALQKTLPFIIMAVLLFGLSMILRTNITEETAYNGTTFSLDPWVILSTLFSQITAAFPLSYRLAGNDAATFGNLIQWTTMFNTSLSAFLSSVCWQDLLACFLLVLGIFSLPQEKPRFSWAIAGFGFLLWLLPGLVISLSWKYQQELRLGLAYIPVFFSYFGAALLFYEMFALLCKPLSNRTRCLLLSGIGCAVLLLSLQDNRHISSMLNDIFLYPREIGEDALRAGILDNQDWHQVVSNVPYSLWEHGWQKEPYQTEFYSLNAGYSVNAIGAQDFAEEHFQKNEQYVMPKAVALITYSGNAEGGFAKSGRLRGTVVTGDGTLNSPLITDLFFYVSGSEQENAVLVYQTKEGETKRFPVRDAWLIRETDKGKLYKLQDEGRPIWFDSIGLITN